MSTERFPSPVASVLRASGWHEGRDIGARAEEMLARSIDAARVEGVELEAFPAIRAALHEFGGLDVTEAALGGPFNGKDFRIDSSLLVRGFHSYEQLGKFVGARCFPLGVQPEEHSALVMAENGEVYLIHDPTGVYYAGASMDAALDALIDMKTLLPNLSEYYDLDVVEESGYRFNDQVTRILFGAGWSLGRDLGTQADDMMARAVALGGALGLSLTVFPAAAAAIREFGGLRFTKEALEEETGFDGTDLLLDPSAALAWPATHAVLERVLGGRCFPLGLDLEFDSVLWIGEEGGVYEVFSDSGAVNRVGETVDKALSNWLQDADLTELAVPSDEAEG